MKITFLPAKGIFLSPGFLMPIHEIRGATPDPADELLHLGMLPQHRWIVVSGGQLWFTEQRVDLPVADQVQRLCLPASIGLGPPMVAVHTGPGEHRPATKGTGPQDLTCRCLPAVIHGLDMFNISPAGRASRRG